MSAAERWRSVPMAAEYVKSARMTAWADTDVGAAALDLLEAALAEPAPVAGGSAEERARVNALADDLLDIQDVTLRGRLIRAVRATLAALDAAEERAAQAERERADQIAKTEDALRWQARTAAACEKAERERDEAQLAAEALAAQISETRESLRDLLLREREDLNDGR